LYLITAEHCEFSLLGNKGNALLDSCEVGGAEGSRLGESEMWIQEAACRFHVFPLALAL